MQISLTVPKILHSKLQACDHGPDDLITKFQDCHRKYTELKIKNYGNIIYYLKNSQLKNSNKITLLITLAMKIK